MDAGTLRVAAAPGEANGISLRPDGTISDTGAPLIAGPGCFPRAGGVVCPGARRGQVELGDGDDTLTSATRLPLTVDGGPGADALLGGDAADVIEPGSGRDWVDGGAGADTLMLREGSADTTVCGPGRDAAVTELRDSLDYGCERVDYGPPGRPGRVRALTGGGRFVPVPGQPWARVDRRILPGVAYLIRRYRVEIGDGLAVEGHEYFGEHPLGLAVDIYPGPGGSWSDVARIARWAEPRQSRPRRPFRWVGWNGDFNHGDPVRCRLSHGCHAHLHLSWAHSPGRPLHPVRRVWVFEVELPASCRRQGTQRGSSPSAC